MSTALGCSNPVQVLTGMLQARPGAYIWIGNGDSAGLHTPHYNFNDDIVTLGTTWWVGLVEAALAPARSQEDTYELMH